MMTSRLYRILLVVGTGGVLFQTTGSCKNQVIDLLLSEVLPSVTSALGSALLSSLTSGSTT